MERLWKGLAVLTMVGLLCGIGGTAHAVLGIPDDVPGNSILYPFFKVNPTPNASSRQDTLIVLTNTSSIAPHVHFTVWSTTSVHLFDFTIVLTAHDVFSCSLLDLFVGSGCAGVPLAPPNIAQQLQQTVLGQTLLVGYITADLVPDATTLFPGNENYQIADCNILVGHEYLVNLPAGSATGFKAVALESYFPQKGQQARLPFSIPPPPPAPGGISYIGFYLNRCLEDHGAPCTFDNLERIDGFTGDLVQTFSGPDSPGLQLIVRYFTLSAINAKTEIWLWKDRNTTSTNIGIAIYDEAENQYSIGTPIPNEVSVIDVGALVSPGIPGGWFRIQFLNSQYGLTPSPIQAVAYSLQTANSQQASLRWDAIFPADRQYTNYFNGQE